jgi:hypothetical protein
VKSVYQLENLKEDELPFTYELKTYDYGDESCVRIHDFPISGMVPEGIDITVKAIENLKEKITAVQQEAKKEVKNLEDRIKALALIEYKPDGS